MACFRLAFRKPFDAIVLNHLSRMPGFFGQGVDAIDAELRIEIRSLPTPIDQDL